MKHAFLVVSSAMLAACGGGGTAAPATPAAARPAPSSPPAAVARQPAAPVVDEVSITSKSPEAIEEYKQGRDLIYNARDAEGVEHLKRAVQLDPQFALALVYLGSYTPGVEGVAMVDRAVELAQALPDPERFLVEGQQAFNNDEIERCKALIREVLRDKPGDWRVQTLMAAAAFDDEIWEEAAAAAQKAIDASPRSGAAYNYLAYSLAWKGRYDRAIAVASKQTELLPDEPNPYDTLGEVLLAAGRLDEAQATFEAATAKSASFTTALLAIAGIRAFKGDWQGAQAALRKAHERAPRPVDAVDVGLYRAWTLAAQGQLRDMLRLHDELEARARAEKLDDEAALVAVNRGFMLALVGRAADAVAALDAADARAGGARLSPMGARRRMLVGLQARLLAAWKMRQPARVDKVFAALAAEAVKVPLRRVDLSVLDWGQGMAALARGDERAAVAAMKKCSEFDTVCRFMLVSAQRAAGDAAGAAETLARLKASPRRDGAYLYFWATMK